MLPTILKRNSKDWKLHFTKKKIQLVLLLMSVISFRNKLIKTKCDIEIRYIHRIHRLLYSVNKKSSREIIIINCHKFTAAVDCTLSLISNGQADCNNWLWLIVINLHVVLNNFNLSPKNNFESVLTSASIFKHSTYIVRLVINSIRHK